MNTAVDNTIVQPPQVTEKVWNSACWSIFKSLLHYSGSKQAAIRLYIGQCLKVPLKQLYGNQFKGVSGEVLCVIDDLAKICSNLGHSKTPRVELSDQSETLTNFIVKQNPTKASLEIIPIAQPIIEQNGLISDDVEIQNAVEIPTRNPNFKLSRLISMSQQDIFRIGGLTSEGQDSITREKTLIFDQHIWKFDSQTKDFQKILTLPMSVYDQQSARRIMGTCNQTLVKVQNLGFLIIGGSCRTSPNSQALFSRDIFFYCLGSESLKLVAQLHQAKDTVTAVILHSSLYILGGRVYSSRQLRGEEAMSKLIERIDLSDLMKAGIFSSDLEDYENQEFLHNNEYLLLQCQVVSLREDLEVPPIPMLCSAVSDERTNSIQIAGGRILNKMSNNAYRFYFCENANSNFVRLIEQDQDLSDACCFIDNSVQFRRSQGRKVVCQIGVSRQLHILILQMRTTESGEIQKHIQYYHKLNANAARIQTSRSSQNSRYR